MIKLQATTVMDAASTYGPLAVLLALMVLASFAFLVKSLITKDKALESEREYSRARDKEDSATLNDLVNIMRLIQTEVKDIPVVVKSEIKEVELRVTTLIKERG
jgi:hypothetical protein